MLISLEQPVVVTLLTNSTSGDQKAIYCNVVIFQAKVNFDQMGADMKAWEHYLNMVI